MNYYSKKVFESGEYESSQFKIGVEIKAGSYGIFSYDNEYDSSICLSTDANQDNIIVYTSFDYNLFLIVKNKQYLEINNAYLVNLEEVKQLDPKKSNMLIIGTHIPEGEYKLSVLPQEDDANYSIYNSLADFSDDNLEDFETFEKQSYVTLKTGQVFEYKDCSFIRVGDLPEEDDTDEEDDDSNSKSLITFSVNGKKIDRGDFVSSFKEALFEAIANGVYDQIAEDNEEDELTDFEREDYEEFEKIFMNTIADYGRLLLRKQNSKKLTALLSDFANKYKKIINEIKVVTENGFVDKLLSIKDEEDMDNLINAQMDLLINENNFTEESAQIVVGMILKWFK